MYAGAINQSSVNASAKANKKSTEDKILEIFVDLRRATVKDIFDQFKVRGWKTSETNSINTTLSRLTNTGLLRQVGESEEGTTVWERTALKTPLDDNRWNRKKILVSLDTMKKALWSIAVLADREENFKVSSDLMRDYASNIVEIQKTFDGYIDRSNEPEFIRRVGLGL